MLAHKAGIALCSDLFTNPCDGCIAKDNKDISALYNNCKCRELSLDFAYDLKALIAAFRRKTKELCDSISISERMPY